MTNEPSPRPWTFCPTYGEHRPNSIIVDADGGNVALVCHFANEEEENRIGNLIVDAVNERDRLRDALERIAGYEDGIVGCIESGHASGIDWDGITFAMIQEARAALGEGETPTGKGVGA